MGLYLNPPENALVLVDEKPSIEALERAQGYLRLPDGKAVNGFSHYYKGGGDKDTIRGPRRNHGACEDHVVSDNLNTYKPREDRWLKRHSQVHFHFIPTYSSWLNQVKYWFSILSRQALRGANFTSARQLRQANCSNRSRWTILGSSTLLVLRMSKPPESMRPCHIAKRNPDTFGSLVLSAECA